MFITKMDSIGNFLWAKTIGGYGQEISGQMAVDEIGNTYFSGYFYDTAYFGCDTLVAHNPYFFTAKYNANGNCLWVRYGGNVPMCAANGALYLSWPNVLYRYDGNANLQWTKNLSGINVSAMAAEKNFLYLTGTFNGTANFDSITLTDTVPRMFIAKLKNPILPVEANFARDSSLRPLEISEKRSSGFELKIFPCPAGNAITISFTSTNQLPSKLTIFNSSGKIISSEEIKEISFVKELNTGVLPKGIYIIELLQENERLMQKFILQ